MEYVPWIVFTAAFGFALVAGWRQADRRQRFSFALNDDATEPKPPADEVPAAPAPAGPTPVPDAYEGIPNTYVLAAPPTVDGMAGPMLLRDWLVHGHPERNNVWADVVSEFYERAAGDHRIADFFAGVDTSPLQKHTLTTLMLITGHGLTVGTVKQMRDRHAHVRDSRGRPITPEVYDAVMAVLGDILSGKGVPLETRRQVQRVLAPVREAIVVRTDEDPDR